MVRERSWVQFPLMAPFENKKKTFYSLFLFYYFSWNRKTIVFDHSSRIGHGFNSRFGIISDNHSEFMTFGIHEFSFYHYFDISFIVSEICGNKSSADIYVVSDNRISNITQMCYIGFISERRVFDFY